MNLDWLHDNLIFVTKHGSVCYGLNNEFSDLDIKGFCIPPLEVENNLFHRFDQAENDVSINEKYSSFANPKNPKVESTIYSLKKIFVLAANVNPNCIELFYTEPEDYLLMTPIMEEIVENRDLFLSSKAKYTFSGYSFSQLAKIERHRKWIVMGELNEPKREDFGLPAERPRQMDEVFGYIKSEVERWNLSKFPMEEMERSELKDAMFDCMNSVSKINVGWDNWPQVYEAGVVEKVANEYDLKDEVVDILNKEREYKRAKEAYTSWINWKKNRNPERHKLEVKCGYDSKHASHLVRLLRMGYEILTEGKVIVKRPDRDEILNIKNGFWSYEKLMEYAIEMQVKLDISYKTTRLKNKVDFEKVNSLYHAIYEKYHSEK